ncbi:MAG TPA: hypothetical protein GX509_07110 [Firmicutes bacterium]|nr:hypothetical protein [Bacillota bacterium]HHY98490.1 hypothetical protein [Bacillota bacterium]
MYWEKQGIENTSKTLDLALARAKELGLKHIVVASNTGNTARPLLGHGINIAVVTHRMGFREPGQDEMTPEARQELSSKGARILTTTHLFSGIERGITKEFGGLYIGGVVAETLRMLGQGTKVAVEIAVMALDSGLIPYGEDVISIGGSSRGADTAIVIRPEYSSRFFETKIREFICKPRDFE